MLDVAIFRKSVVPVHYVHEQRDGLIPQLGILRTRPAFRFWWSVEEPVGNEGVIAHRHDRAGAARNAAAVHKNFHRVLVPLASKLYQLFNALSLHPGVKEPLACFLLE